MQILARLRRSEPDFSFCTLVAFALAGLVFALQGHVGFGMQDESFLWYGVQHTHAGELPLRDFRSYDPGRYFWCAGWAVLFGDGIVAVRAASWIFAALGLACGLSVARRVVVSRWMLIPVALLLGMWMWPPWKLFESGVAMIAVLIATRLVEQPDRGRHVAAGVFVGLAAFFGRNLGLYTGLGFGLLTLFLAWKTRSRDVFPRIGALALGVVIGYSPMIVLCLFASGFGAAFVDSVRFYFGQSALNAERSAPWPWSIDYSGKSATAALASFSVGLSFVLLASFYVAAFALSLGTKLEDLSKRAVLIAAVFMGGFIAHHASVRSDVFHLAQSIHPLLLGLIALPTALAGRRVVPATLAVLVGLLVCGVFAVGLKAPAVERALATPPDEFVTTRIGVDQIWMEAPEARTVESLRALIEHYVKPDQQLWVSARYIGLYPILGRRSPLWDIYPAWSADDALQQRLLRELDEVDWALIDMRPVGGDPNMTLPVSHPLVWQSLQVNFERVPLNGAANSLLFLKRKDA